MIHSLISLDFGNSNPHAGFFKKTNKWELLEVVPLSDLNARAEHYGVSPHNAQLVLSQVKPYDEDLFELQSQGYLLTRVRDYWRGERFAGMPVHYAKTLGEDRLIAAFWVYKTIRRPSLVIDAGTYLTMDVVTNEGFQGGYIIPSHGKYLEAFNSGENLKEVPLTESLNFKLPDNTMEAMSASYQAFTALAEKLIKQYGLETVIISGGKDSLWKEWAKTQDKQIMIVPHIIHQSLIYWMTTQVELL